MEIKSLLQPVILEMLNEMEPVFQQLGIDFYILGAIARDFQLGGYIADRKTNDVDLAIRVGNESQYNMFKSELIKTGNFTADPIEAVKLYYKSAIELDLLPFGDIENENGEVSLHQPVLFVIKMPGLKELYPFVEEIKINALHPIKICSLEGIVLLKLIAYDDQPSRTKDISDIDLVLRYYFDLHDENIYEKYFDVMDLYSTNHQDYLKLVSARVIGRKMDTVVQNSPELKQRLLKILKRRPTDLWLALLAGLSEE